MARLYMTPLWKITSGAFAGYRSGDKLYDAWGEHVGYFRGDSAYALSGPYLGELHSNGWIGKPHGVGSVVAKPRAGTGSIGASQLPNITPTGIADWDDPEF